ncbi:MAG: nucleotidyltransferase [Armatimonadota bacterium]
MKIDWKNIDIKELAGLVCQYLKDNGIEAVLVGGACVSIYSRNKYLSGDLDFITYSTIKEIEPVLRRIGFIKESGRHFEHPQCRFFVEFPPPPIAIGSTPIEEFKKVKTKYGVLKLLMVEDCIKDRLAAFYFWNDLQSLEQAVLITKVCKTKLDFASIKKWSKQEGVLEKYQKFLKLAKKDSK